MTNPISIFGSSGFIGDQFFCSYGGYPVARNEDSPLPNSDALYLISTNHNYNIFDNPLIDIKTNLIKLVQVLERFKELCPNNVFNFISSWFVYGDTEYPAKEDSYCNPKGFYSITKRTAEQLVVSYCNTFNLNYRILRLCNVYGEHATDVSSKRNALQFMIKQIIDNKDIKLYNGGSDVRDFMHVEDVCRAIKLCVDKASKNTIINIGSGIPQDFKSIMEYTKMKTNSRSNFIDIEPPEFHKIAQVKDMFLDVNKLKNLGFEQQISIHDGIDRICKYHE